MSPVAGILEAIDSPLYDTISLPLGMSYGNKAIAFEHPIGAMFARPKDGKLVPKTLLETNLIDSRALSAPHRFVVAAIRAALFSRDGLLLPLTSRFYRGGVLDFRIAQKPYWTGPLWKCADPAALFFASDRLAAFDKDERAELIRALRCGISKNVRPEIREYEPFHVEIAFDKSFGWRDLTAPGSLVVLLEGIRARAVV